MEKKTLGAFVAALRKANGLTQQELADKLNVSNKAVSRWERDECAPDITLIPALAEILGVTCDELLKGERILSNSGQENQPKVEKQVKALINRSISNFITLIWISLALSAVGLVCMFGISYGAFRPIIGFAVMSLFAVAAFVLAAIATTKTKGIKRENDLFETADEVLKNRYNKTLGGLSFIAFFSVISVVALSLPLVIFTSDYVNSVLTFSSYLKYVWVVVLALVLLWISVKDIYFLWITEQLHKEGNERNLKLILMNGLQLGAIALASILFLIKPYFETASGGVAVSIISGFAYAFLVSSTIIFAVLMFVCKSDRKKLLLSGLRNLLIIIPSLLLLLVNHASFDSYGEKYYIWNIDYIILSLALTLFIFLIFQLIKIFIRNKKLKNSK